MAAVPTIRSTEALQPCDPAVAFRFQDGRTARSLRELAEAIDASPLPVVDVHRTHFHHWIRDVVRDEPLAREVERLGAGALRGEAVRAALVRTVRDRIRALERGR